MLDIAGLGLIMKMGKLIGLGTSVEAKERAQIVTYLNGLTVRLEAIASAIRGTSNQGLAHLCALLEGYGTVGAGQLSAALKQANIAEVSETIRRIARAIREQDESGWTPEARQSALRTLDGARGEFSGAASFLAEYSGQHSKPRIVEMMKRVSYRSIATVAATAVLGVSAKAANLLSGDLGSVAADAAKATKETLIRDGAEIAKLVDDSDDLDPTST